jgi:WD40 repeat protein
MFELINGAIVSGSSDNTIRLWETANGQELRQLSGHSGWVWPVAFRWSADHQR